jgi:SRSO17 transposase
MSDSFQKQKNITIEAEDGNFSEFVTEATLEQAVASRRASAHAIKGTPRKPQQQVGLEQSFRQD